MSKLGQLMVPIPDSNDLMRRNAHPGINAHPEINAHPGINVNSLTICSVAVSEVNYIVDCWIDHLQQIVETDENIDPLQTR